MGWPLRRESTDIRTGWFHHVSATSRTQWSALELHMSILLLFAWKGDIACMAWSQNCMYSCTLELISTTVSGNDDLTLLIRLFWAILCQKTSLRSGTPISTCRIQKHREDYHQCLSGSGKDCHWQVSNATQATQRWKKELRQRTRSWRRTW